MPDQVDTFLQKAKAATAEPSDAPQPAPDPSAQQPDAQPQPPTDAAPQPDEGSLADQPKVPFQTDLKLTGRQEKKMIEHAFKRMRDLMSDMGREATLQPNWWMNSPGGAATLMASQGLLSIGDTFLGKRSRFDATFLNDVSWRAFTMGPNTIFSQSNLVVPLARRICRQMIARAKNSFFSTDPWFSVDPAPEPASEVDDELASQVERFVRFKLRQSNSKEDKGRAISRALTLGECVVKTSYVVRDQIFNVEAMVLTDHETGEPTKDTQGNTITQDDKTEDRVDDIGNQSTVLSRDPDTVMPEAPVWTKQLLDRRQVLFEGAKSEPIFYKDFLCPLTAVDVQQADTCVHLYDKSVMEFVDLIVKRGMAGDTTAGRIGAAQKMVALISALSNNSNQPKAAVNQETRPGENFNMAPGAEAGPVAEFAEFYMWYDANEDGIAENIMLIADRASQAPVFYDHVANVTTDGLRPLEVVRINPVEGRWYGLGIMELFESYQTITDLLVNRWNFSQSRAGRVDLWSPQNTEEGQRDPQLRMNWGGTYTKKTGMKKEDILESVFLNDTKFEQTHIMIQFFMQLAMNESGVTNANDDQAAGMQSSKLATGIIQIEKSGDELFMPIMEDLTGPLTRLVDREICVTLANMNQQEAFTYLEGDVQQIETLDADAVRQLKFKCNIELTSHRNQQQIQMSAQCAALVQAYYQLPPEIQIHVAPFYRQQLTAIDPKVDADTIIQIVQPALGQPPGAPAAGGSVTQFPGAAAPAQLMQSSNQMAGASAPGGTPAG